MANVKTWNIVAAEIIYDKVELWATEDGLIHLKRGYRFLDANGLEMKQQAGEYEEAFEWGTVPQNVRDALTFIDTFSITKIKEKEGIT
jgi:hypothetical protein